MKKTTVIFSLLVIIISLTSCKKGDQLTEACDSGNCKKVEVIVEKTDYLNKVSQSKVFLYCHNEREVSIYNNRNASISVEQRFEVSVSYPIQAIYVLNSSETQKIVLKDRPDYVSFKIYTYHGMPIAFFMANCK